MNQNIQSKIVDKISEDISPTRNLTGLHLKIVFGIAILWTFFQLWYASPFPFWFNIGMFKGLPARAIHLGFALTLTFLIFQASRGKQIAIITKGRPIALLVASNNITIPIVPIIISTGTLKPNTSLTKSIPPLLTKSS